MNPPIARPAGGLRAQLAAAAQKLSSVAQRPRFEAELLLAHVLGLSRAGLLAADDALPSAERLTRIEELVERRARGEPMAYLLGRREFWSLDLAVTLDTLVPRPETEGLVEWALERLDADGEFHVADLGTGSGAIALAIASERPRARVIATDASSAALAVALGNARRLGLSNVEFSQGDWCAALPAHIVFDVIVSNPPYVADGDPHLADLRFEPMAALTSGTDGLDAIRSIIVQSVTHLRTGGALLMEHGLTQAAAIQKLLSEAGYREIETRRDLAGHERLTGGVRS
jgi:release factor glutamine methyltransferase